MEYQDYYQVLGVDKGASDKDIKRAYRRMARKYHPDMNPDDDQAKERFQRVQQAYDVLGDVYVIKEDTEQAVQCFKKSLELNPRNSNAQQMLKKLGKN